MAKNSFNRQFKGGYFPDQPVDNWNPLNGHSVASPSKQRKRDSLGLGTQTQARPGLAGMQGRNKPKRGR